MRNRFCWNLILLLVVGCCITTSNAKAQRRRVNYTLLRHNMVRDFIEREGITNKRVLEVMRTVPRHEFMLSGMKDKSYYDGAWAIGHKQTISPPYIVAYMTEVLDPQPTDKVLEIGTGSGYQSAVLSGLVKEVYSIEIVKPLGRSAARRLKKLKYKNIITKIDDGYKGWKEHAPFDKIIVTCSPEDIPQPLVDQLKDGGRMLIPVGERYQQVFHLLTKKDGKLIDKKLIPTLFVPMTGISETKRRVQPDPLNPKIINGEFELDTNGDDRADHWHYQRQTTLVKSADAPEGQYYMKMSNTDDGRLAQLLQGFPLQGAKIGAIKVQLWVKYDGTAAGREVYQKPMVSIQFYSATRKLLGKSTIGPWLGTLEWQPVSKIIAVPKKAREAIIRIGLNGATGELSVDHVRLTIGKR